MRFKKLNKMTFHDSKQNVSGMVGVVNTSVISDKKKSKLFE